ncbi:FAD-binding oxidoreductase [uncultured Roseovarius sp.]|uniref:FAD-binding oxidoreductase n=1 Tax=uncultured Roseovarius sp. TaxID=293344 RepID=UPI002624AF7C|nr:FAD-binding oxidoreductase [uncultured Roseovarius sp.]
MRNISHLSRRQVLAGSAALATLGMRPASARDLAIEFDLPTAALDELRQSAGPRIYLPGDPGFGLKARVNNLRYFADLPRAVVVCPNAGATVQTVNWLRSFDIPFQIKGGGHSYAGYSAGPDVVVFTQGMDQTEIFSHPDNPATTLLKVGAGAINYKVYDTLEENGLTLTHGRCPTVGIAGFVLGGGIGFDMRHLGLASDLLIETQIVLANGTEVTASATQNTDLFWALRGGAGGSFGVSTSFTFETLDVSQMQIGVFNRTWRSTDQHFVAQFLHQMMALFQADDTRQLGTRLSVTFGTPPDNPSAPAGYAINLVGQWIGPPADLRALFDQLDGDLPPVTVAVDYHGPYWIAQHLLEEPEEEMFYQERSTFIPTTPNEAALHDALSTLQSRPDVHGTCDLRFFQTGGAVNDMMAGNSAFVHRDSEWLPLIGFYWTGQDQTDPALLQQGHDWQDRFYMQIVDTFGGAGAYQNFPDPSLQDFATAYFRGNLDRLRQVKAKYDPQNLFTFAQSVPPL